MNEKNNIETTDDNLYFINLTIDLAFKFIFGEPKNIELLKSLLTDITKLPIERLEGLGFMSEELHRDSLSDHKTIVDVRAVLTDKTQVEVEMQVQNYHDMDKRSLHIWSKMYSAQMNRNDSYIDLAKCICINITAFDFTKEEDGHSKYVIKNEKTNERFMDDLEIHFVELPKREKVGDIRLKKWMELFASKTWEEMAQVAEGDDIMSQVYNQARDIAKNDTKRIEVENRERWVWDNNSLITDAKRQGRREERIEIAKSLLDVLDIKTIAKKTKLTISEVEALKGDR